MTIIYYLLKMVMFILYYLYSNINPVMTDLQVLRQDQIAIRIRKEAGMNRCCRIGCHLLDIFLIIKIP